MPVSVAARIFIEIRSIESFAIASRLPDSTVLNGSTFLRARASPPPAPARGRGSTSPASTSGARPRACRPGRRWRCARRAARSSGCPAWWSSFTNATIACLAGPSFQDGSGSVCAAARARRRAGAQRTPARTARQSSRCIARELLGWSGDPAGPPAQLTLASRHWLALRLPSSPAAGPAQVVASPGACIGGNFS